MSHISKAQARAMGLKSKAALIARRADKAGVGHVSRKARVTQWSPLVADAKRERLRRARVAKYSETERNRWLKAADNRWAENWYSRSVHLLNLAGVPLKKIVQAGKRTKSVYAAAVAELMTARSPTLFDHCQSMSDRHWVIGQSFLHQYGQREESKHRHPWMLVRSAKRVNYWQPGSVD